MQAISTRDARRVEGGTDTLLLLRRSGNSLSASPANHPAPLFTLTYPHRSAKAMSSFLAAEVESRQLL